MTDIAKLGLEIRSDGVVVASKRLDGMAKSAGRAETASERLSRRAAAVSQTMGRLAAVGGAAMAALTANSLRLAVAAEETASKFQVVFRGSVASVNDELVKLTETVPLTVTQMRGLASGVQDMLVPLGLAREEAAGMSVEAVRLAADLASFNNTDADIVLQNIQSALAGSSEPMRKFGVDVRETRLQTIAYEQGIASLGEELTQAQRAQAVFAAITADSSDALGDAARTADSAANQMRFLARDFRQAQEDLGQALIPSLQLLLSELNAVGDDGLTPLQSGLVAVSNLILTTSRAVLMAVSGWHVFTNAISELKFELMDLATDPAIASGLDFIAGVFNPSMAVQGGAGALANNAEAARVAREQTAQARAESAAELEATLDELFGVIAAMEKAQAGLGSGIDRSLKESRKAFAAAASSMDKLADSGESAAQRIESSFFGLGDILSGAFESLEGAEAAIFEDMAQQVQFLKDELFPAEKAMRELAEARELINKANETAILDDDDAQRMLEALDDMADSTLSVADAMDVIGDTIQSSIRTLQQGVERGSDEYKKLEIAAQAANLVQAAGAVLNQANGDPYTAFARMAAMAAAVASLGYSVGSLGGGSDPTAERQANLGTGSVLGDPTAQSESIANAIEITANATEKLVGINTGMLRALHSLSDAITGATTLLAGQLNNIDFGPIGEVSSLGAVFGGSIDVSDSGITIAAGSLEELMGGALVQAFQEVTERKHWFDDYDTDRRVEDLNEATAEQFGQIFTALVDTVTEAAKIIGFTTDEIQAALDGFEVWQQDISFEDMNAEEQQAALEAYFSQIFDSIAHEVVPFLTDLQKLGEGAGETLVRVATSLEVFDYALERLGFQFGMTEEMFGSMEGYRYRVTLTKVALIEAAGGLDEFIDQLNEFFEAFASDALKLEMVTDAVRMRFNELGLSLPKTRDGVWDLMQSLDGSTEAGQAAIAMLLEITPLLDQYYDAIEEGERERLAQAQAIRDFVGLGPSDALVALEQRFVDAMQAAQSLNASQAEYAMIVRAFDRQLEVMAAQMMQNIISMSQNLFDSETGELADSFENDFERVREVSNELFTDWQSALQGIADFTKSVLLDENLTQLTPEEQLNEAQAQFDDLLRRARAGDVDAAAGLPQAAQKLLEEARFMFASGAEYQAIFDRVLAQLDGIEMPKGIPETITEISQTARDINGSIREMQDQLSSDLQKLIQANDLANSLRELSFVVDRSAIDLANELGVPIEGLVQALGVDLEVMNDETVLALAGVAELLGVDLQQLGDALGMDLAGIAEELGLVFDQFNFESQFATEIDLLSSIDMHMEIVSNYFSRLLDPFPKEKGGAATLPVVRDPNPPTFAQVPAPAASAPEREQVLEEIREVLVEIREEAEERGIREREETASIAQGLNETAEVLRRRAVA